MASEAVITSDLKITVGGIQYRSPQPSRFTANASVANGPTPGAFPVSTSGTDINLSLLTTPGLCVVQNLDATNYVTLGVYESDTDMFYPFAEYLPGESYVLRLARFLNRESTGTGTLVGYNARLQLRANGATVWVRVDAFEKGTT